MNGKMNGNMMETGNGKMKNEDKMNGNMNGKMKWEIDWNNEI